MHVLTGALLVIPPIASIGYRFFIVLFPIAHTNCSDSTGIVSSAELDQLLTHLVTVGEELASSKDEKVLQSQQCIINR